MIKLLQWCVRIGWLAALALGILLWRGMFIGAIRAHMALGGLVVLSLAALAVLALLARVRIPLAIVSIVWAAVTFYVGIMQLGPRGSNFWMIEILHLALGIGAIGIAEALAGALKRRSLF
jgi:hypothetical protein